MRKNIVFLMAMSLLFISCNEKKKDLSKVVSNNLKMEFVQNSEGYNLLKMKCYACHSVVSSSHDAIIAPPMAAVKRRYSMQFNTKESFVNAITKWAVNPNMDDAKMRGAVAKFQVMPKQNFKEEEIRKIAVYMYENDLEQPEWFAVREKEMYGNGRRGMGMNRN